MAFGAEDNTGKFNEPGLYKDPVSGAELVHNLPAGADALVRMGWKLVKTIEELDAEELKAKQSVPEQKTKEK